MEYDYNLISRGGDFAAAEQRRYRAECRVRVLESSLDRIDMKDFDRTLDELTAARAELHEAAWAVLNLRYRAWQDDTAAEMARWDDTP